MNVVSNTTIPQDQRRSGDQVQLQAEGIGDRLDQQERRIGSTTLDPGDVTPRDADSPCQGLLRDVEGEACLEAGAPE